MNSDVQRFLRKNGINPIEISQSENGRIKSPQEINKIVSKYGFYKSRKTTEISIEDIVGYDYQWNNINPNIAYSMDSFFNSLGDGYHSRSVGLLDYTAEDAVKKINFERERIVVDEMGDNKYIISTNGLHRYTVLRILYLSEYVRLGGNEKERNRLREKYTIPVEFRELDEFKTYSKYILMTSLFEISDIEKEYDSEKWIYTGRLVIKKKDKEQILIESDEDLLEYVKSKANIINQNISDLQWAYNTYPSFRTFLETYYKDVLDINQLKENSKSFKEIEEGDVELW